MVIDVPCSGRYSQRYSGKSFNWAIFNMYNMYDILNQYPNRLSQYDIAADRAGDYFLDEIWDSSSGFYKSKMRKWFKQEYGAYIQFIDDPLDEAIPVIMHIDPEKEILFKLEWG